MTDDLNCIVKLFADDTSLFTIVKDPKTAADDMNHDLNLIQLWANKWRISFNPDPRKQAIELIFSTKRDNSDHPMLYFNNLQVTKLDKHTHLGFVLDSKLSFLRHINAAISKSRKALGILKLLSKYRPHLDYGGMIYHIPNKEDGQHCHGNFLMQKLESVQYSAALAITGAWRGTSREKIYRELGWESLYSRRWSRRLFMLYKIINNLMPDYISEPIPNMNQSNYNLRNQPVIGQIRARTDKYRASFFPDSLLEWSKLDPEIRQSPSINVFKSRLL